jgi:hypothetical protein
VTTIKPGTARRIGLVNPAHPHEPDHCPRRVNVTGLGEAGPDYVHGGCAYMHRYYDWLATPRTGPWTPPPETTWWEIR